MALAALLALALPGVGGTSETVVFESCDNHGKSIPARPDSGQVVLVTTVGDQHSQQIRYNPEILPRLSTNARLFFYAHQCARLGFGEAAAAARRADCVALNTLLDGKQLNYRDLPALQTELQFSPEEWSLLPGPPRNIDLTNCRPSTGDVLRVPLAREASPQQDAWNSCVRSCADRLWNCRKSGADACQLAYDQCRSNCRE